MLNIENMVFGKLTVIKHVPGYKGNNTHFLCRCHCGKEKIIYKSSLLNGNTRSCGCLRKEANLKHGLIGTRLYPIWLSMRARCLNKNNKAYKNYGGRGITICNRWLKFENFYADMGKQPKGMMLERIDNNGNYEPSNCKWATTEEQANNRRTNVFVTYENERKTVTQWSKKVGIRPQTLTDRLCRGWNTKDALNIPVKVRAKP